MHFDRKIACCETDTVYTHTWMASIQFPNFQFPHCDQVAQMAFWAKVRPVLVEVRWFLCAFSMSADSLLCHFGMESSRLCDFNKPLPGVFLSQPSPIHAQETLLLTSSLLGLRCKVSWSGVAFRLLGRTTTLLSPFWQYSEQGACQTVLAVPDLLASP